MEDSERKEPGLPAPSEGGHGVPADPPHPLDGQWHINILDKTYGPYTGHILKTYIQDGRMSGDTMVLRAGKTEWTRADADPILAAYLPKPTPATGLSGKVTAAEGATVVQVTNNIGQAGPALDGPAAPKSAVWALILSLLIPGLGQCYNGEIGKGIFMFIACVVLWIWMLGWIIWIWTAVDAYQTAKAMNLRYLRLTGANVWGA